MLKRIRINNLFVKIFLSFWLTHLLLIFGTVATIYVAQKPQIQNIHDTKPQQLTLLRKATSNLINFGVEYTEAWLVSQPLQLRDKLYIVNTQNDQDILNRKPPKYVNFLTEKVGEFTPVLHFLGKDNLYVARYTELPGEQAYILVVLLPGMESNWRYHILENPGVSLTISVLVTGLICYFLARYIVGPIRKLRNASKQIAHGDLDVKVSPEFGKRNDELIELARDFDQMTEDLKSSVEMQQRLIKDVSHELKSPLARQQVAIEIARNKIPEDAQPLLEKIELESQRLRDIIYDVLNLPEAQALKHLDRSESTYLEDIVLGVEQEAQHLLETESKSLSLDIRIKNAIVATKGHLLGNAIFNIVQNAIRHTPEHSEVNLILDEVETPNPKNTGSTSRNSFLKSNSAEPLRCYAITITDQGPGVPDQQLPLIFKAFYRVEEARDRHSGGVGLGLAIAKRIVELHNGHIAANNLSPNGLAVTIYLPIEHPDQEKAD